jgi:hypothetical protein
MASGSATFRAGFPKYCRVGSARSAAHAGRYGAGAAELFLSPVKSSLCSGDPNITLAAGRPMESQRRSIPGWVRSYRGVLICQETT